MSFQRNLFSLLDFFIYKLLAEQPGVARWKFEEKKFWKKDYNTPPATNECPQKNSAQSV